METALVTGMLETEFLPRKQAKTDVKNDIGGFGAILESSLKSNDITKEKQSVTNTEKEQLSEVTSSKVNEKDVEVAEEVEEIEDATDEIKEESSKKDKKNKNQELIFQNQVVNVISKDVELKNEEMNLQDVELKSEDVITLVGSIKNGELKIAPEEKLDNLLSKLDVKLTKNVEIKDDSEKVIEVGPQSVETEKIKLNIKDVENKKRDNIENDKFVSEDKINNPTIQNPFKIKKLTDQNETNALNDENIISEKDNLLKNDEINRQTITVEKDVEITKDEMSTLEEKLNLLGKKLNTQNNKEDVKVENNFLTDIQEVDDIQDVAYKKEFEATIDDKNSEVDETLMLNNKDVFAQIDSQKNQTEHNDKRNFDEKQGKLKVKDFRNQKDVDFSQRFFEGKDVKIDNKFEIKDVNTINKFENLNFEQDLMEQVTEKLEVSLFDNKSEMVIKLKPNDLGKVTVKISIENGVMNAKFLADSIKVKETLESNLNNLKESLKEQGLNVQELNVSVDSGRSQNFNQNNLVYFNNRSYKSNNNDEVSYENTYYEFLEDTNATDNVRNYWEDSTVSFLA